MESQVNSKLVRVKMQRIEVKRIQSDLRLERRFLWNVGWTGHRARGYAGRVRWVGKR